MIPLWVGYGSDVVLGEVDEGVEEALVLVLTLLPPFTSTQ
jgi:hypothetical protein